MKHLRNITQNCLYLRQEQPLWTVLCDWQEILYPPHWDSYSPLIKSSWGKGWAVLGKAAQERLQKESALQADSQGMQSLLPELAADLYLSGEIRLQRNNPLVLKLKWSWFQWTTSVFQVPKVPPQLHCLLELQQWQITHLFDKGKVFLASEGNTAFPIADIKILWWSVPYSVYLLSVICLLFSSFWAEVHVCTVTQSSDQRVISVFVCLFTGLI